MLYLKCDSHVFKEYMYYLQYYDRLCCIGYTNSRRRREVPCPIQHGREYFKVCVIRMDVNDLIQYGQ